MVTTAGSYEQVVLLVLAGTRSTCSLLTSHTLHNDEIWHTARSYPVEFRGLLMAVTCLQRLLLPTKCWAEKVGIHTSPDIQRPDSMGPDRALQGILKGLKGPIGPYRVV